MPSLRIKGSDVKGLMPSVDARATGDYRLLDGKNVAWDSRGPKTGYSSRMLTPFPITAQKDVDGLRVGPYTFVFPQDCIMAWPTIAPLSWTIYYAFNTPIPASQKGPWHGIYFNGLVYLAQRYRGFFASTINNLGNTVFSQKTSADIPGLIPNVQALDVVRGRAIIVNATTIQWGAVGNLTSLAPAPGGAGFQAISQYTKGDFVALATYQNGFIVWTTGGAISAEFIDGDSVWRFDTFRSLDRPISQDAIVTLITGGSVILSHQGVQVFDGNQMQPLSSDFNEFLRDYMKDRIDTETYWRLEYDQNRQMIYVMESTDFQTYHNTFVLYPTIDRWGIFSERVSGILPLTNDLFGYIDAQGRVCYFIETINRGDDPMPATQVSRFFPRIDKSDSIPSSSAVSNDYYMNAAAILMVDVPAAGWYDPASDMPTSGYMKGMDSWMNIGYFRPEELNQTLDQIVEIQQIILGSLPTQPNVLATDATVSWKTNVDGSNYFFTTTQDWNSAGAAEDWNANGTAEDWMWAGAGLPITTYGLKILGSEDGITVDERIPNVSRFFTGALKYSAMTWNVLNVIHVEASAVNEFFHGRYIELTGVYGGVSG